MQAPDFKAESDSDDDEDQTDAGRRARATIPTRPAVDPGEDVHVSLKDVTGPEFKDQVRNVVDPSGTRRERRLRVGNGGKIGQGGRAAAVSLEFKDQVRNADKEERDHNHPVGDPDDEFSAVAIAEESPPLVPVDRAPVGESILNEIERLRELERQQVIQAHAFVPSSDVAASTARKKKIVLFVGIPVLIGAAALGLLLWFLLGGRGENDTTESPTGAPIATTSPPPTAVPVDNDTPTSVPTTTPLSRTETLQQILWPVSGASLTAFGTPQQQALNWLANVDPAQMPAEDTQEVRERYILAVLYLATMGASWNSQFSFLDGVSVCEWRDPDGFDGTGVSCNQDGYVSEINLSNNNLEGNRLPAELAFLSDMTVLTLTRHKSLRGPFPTELAGLPQLKTLDLSRSALTGSLPTELGDFAALETLDLANNCFTGWDISSELGKLSRLKQLYLEDNYIVGSLPSEMGNLTDLIELRLEYNGFAGTVPAEWSGLSNLERLSLYGNGLQGDLGPIFCNDETPLLTFLSADCYASANTEAEILCQCCTSCCITNDGLVSVGEDRDSLCCNPEGECEAEDLLRSNECPAPF